MRVTAAIELDITDLTTRTDARRHIPYLGERYALRLIVGTLPPDHAIVRAIHHADPSVCQVTAATQRTAERWRKTLASYTPPTITDKPDQWDRIVEAVKR